MLPPFKVGDTVICVNNWGNHHLNKGKKYIVTKIVSRILADYDKKLGTTIPYWVYVRTDQHEFDGGWYCEMFQAINSFAALVNSIEQEVVNGTGN